MSNFLASMSPYEFFTIAIAIVTLIFNIVSSDKSLKFAEKTVKVLGKLLIGFLSLTLGSLLLSFLNGIPANIAHNQYLLLSVFAGSAISLFSSSFISFWKSFSVAIVLSVLFFLGIDYFQNQKIGNEFSLISYWISGITAGVLIVVLQSIFKLRTTPSIQSIKNPFYD